MAGKFRRERRAIYVTRPLLAPPAEYRALLREIWKTGMLTNSGPFLRRLESELRERLGVGHLTAVTNGTIALQLGIRALGLRGEIITTPFSWVATCSAITWEHCTPVFCDVDPESFNIDPALIEERITPRTTGIMPVHVFSVPCDVERIQSIATQRGLKVLYDAAHAMFVQCRGRSVLAWGDISATSFHATKVFNTGEGGACITEDPAIDRALKQMRYFGYEEWRGLASAGSNAKMTELHAALGLVNLRHVDEALARRRARHALYVERLQTCPYIRFQRFDPESYNYSYMPVVFETEALREGAERRLQQHNVFPRRYFFPSLNTSPALPPGPPMPVAESLAARILCLPLYPTLQDDQIENICEIVRAA